jgi:hypothetical protein
MTLAQIADSLQAQLQNGQIELKDSTIAEVPLSGLLNLLNSSSLAFQNARIEVATDRVTLTGIANILGATEILLEAAFQETEGKVGFALSAKQLPVCRIPGASWLELRNAQIALQVIGQADEITGSIAGTLRVGNTEIATVLLVQKLQSDLVLQWSIVELDLSAITQTFLDGAALPPDLPNVAFKEIEAIVKPTSGEFSFQAASAAPLSFPASGNGFSITELSIDLKRVLLEDATSQIESAIAMRGENSLRIADELSLNSVDLAFNLQGRDWQLAGAVEAELFDKTITLAAAYSQTATERSLNLSIASNPAIKLIDLDESGHFSVSAVALELVQERATEPDQSGSTAWSVAATGAIAVTDVVDFQGTLKLFKNSDETAGLVFEPTNAKVHIPLPPDQTAAMDLMFGGVSFIRRINATTGRSEFTFEAAVDMAFQGWHPTVHQYLPETIATTFKADRTGVTLTADRVLQPFDFVIPDIEIDADTRIALGAASIDMTDLRIQLGQTIAIGAEVGVGLPAELNKLFGVKADGSPEIEFFNTFDPNDRDNTVIKTRLTIGLDGIKITPATSIIRAIELVEENGETWWYCKLGADGEFGEVKFKVPVFAFSTTDGGFSASGAFETIKPLSLPLTPIKQLLAAAKLQGAADALPRSLPLKEIKIVDDQGNFEVDELIEVMGSIGANLPAEMKEALATIEDHLDELPDSFKDYLNIEIPQSFAFNVIVTPEGSVSFDARVKEGDPPIKLLQPGLFGVLPVLNGIQLKGLSFGALAGGSLFSLKVDAVFDQFDLITLAGALALGNIPNLPLPSSRTLHRRLVLDKLFMIIVYQTVIPIPVPLFYDEIGIQYLGLEGVQLSTHAQFPLPSLNLAEVGKVLSDLKRFFTDRDFLLDPNTPPQDFDLKFGLRKNFVQLPQYMGGELLGDRVNGPQISAYQNLAHLLNGAKTLSVNELIQAMPLSQRVGNAGVAFGPISGSLNWLITTPDEFRQIAYSSLGLANSTQADNVLSVLPKLNSTAPNNEEGMVVFLKGNAAIANLASFETVFGLAASGTMGFHTGFQMTGKVSNLLELGMAGRVAIQGSARTADDAFRLEGQSNLKFRDRSIFQGNVQISDQRFRCQGSLDLFGVGGSVMMQIDRSQGAELRGELNAINLPVFKLTGANGRPQPSVLMQIRPNQVPVLDISGAVELLGLRSETSIRMSEDGFFFSTTGRVFNAFSCTLQASGQRLNNTANFRVSATMQNDLHQFLKTEATQVIKTRTDAAVADIQAARRRVEDAQREVDRLNREIENQRNIVRGERASSERAIRDAQAKVDAAQREVDRLNNEINSRNRRIAQLRNAQSCTNIPLVGRVCVPDPAAAAEITKLGIEIGGLEAARLTATGTLTAAQGTLELVRRGAVTTPIDLDPRVSGLIVAHRTATGVLSAAQLTLRGTESAVGALAQVGTFIAQNGIEALLFVNAASFTADLNAAAGGQVTMALQLNYMRNSVNLSLNFNFNDPIASARALAQALLNR